MATQPSLTSFSAVPVRVWYDAEADYLEVLFSAEAGWMQETDTDNVLARVNDHGAIIGFAVLHARTLASAVPLEVELAA